MRSQSFGGAKSLTLTGAKCLASHQMTAGRSRKAVVIVEDAVQGVGLPIRVATPIAPPVNASAAMVMATLCQRLMPVSFIGRMKTAQCRRHTGNRTATEVSFHEA